MTVTFEDGFDLYATDVNLHSIPGTPWLRQGASVNNVKVFANEGRRGTGSLAAITNINLNQYMYLPSSAFGTGTNHVRINFAIAAGSTLMSPGRYSMSLTLNFGGALWSFFFALNGRIQLWTGGALFAETSFSFSSNIYYPVNFFANYNTGELDIKVNGVTLFSGTTPSYAGAGLSEVRIGACAAVPTSGGLYASGTLRLDDLVISFDGPDLGDDVGVFTLFPDADGTNQDWVPASGANGFDMIDAPPDDTTAITDFVTGTTNGDLSDFDTPGLASTVFGVAAVSIQSYVQKTTVAAAEMSLDLRYNGSIYAGTSKVLSTEYNLETQRFTVNPVTGVPWTPADLAFIDGLRLNRTT